MEFLDYIMFFYISGINFVILSIIAIFIGAKLNQLFLFLHKNNIPKAVSGGLLFSLIIYLANEFDFFSTDFSMTLRNILLLVFFSTVGLNAKFKTLIAGGKPLILLLIPYVLFLFLQNVLGISLCELFGDTPIHGLFTGSIPLSGGHGTAIAWGQQATSMGLEHAEPIGISFATFGLILGGLIGGPLATYLIRKNALAPEDQMPRHLSEIIDIPNAETMPSIDNMLKTFLFIGLSLNIGLFCNQLLSNFELIFLPDFVLVMFTSILIANIADLLTIDINTESIDICNGVSLEIFLAMSLISLKFSSFNYELIQMIFILLAQVILIVFYTIYCVFPCLGKDYDAAVICSGFVGAGLGATPVAIGNMSAITGKYGHSAKAFLIMPLVGAFFIDIANSIILKSFFCFLGF